MNERYLEEYLHKLRVIQINDLLFYIVTIGQRVHFQACDVTCRQIICEQLSNSIFHFYEE